MSISLVLFCSGIYAESLENIKKKEINQTFTVGGNDLLQIENKYGNITVTHWNKNEVSIKVIVESKAKNDSEAQRGLDRVDIELRQSGNTVSGSTSLKSQSGWSNNNRLTINYYISMPSRLSANLSQKYGGIVMPERNEGKCNLEVKYGNIQAGSFSAPLSIDAGYSNINVNDVERLNLQVSYCGNVSINNGKMISIDSKYSNLNLRNIEKLTIDKKYGGITIQSVNSASMELKYSEATIEKLKDEINVTALSYSTLNVNELVSGFKTARVEARYGNLNLQIPSKASFNVRADGMKYGNVEIKGFNITNSNIENKTNHSYQINGNNNKSNIQFDGNNYSNLRIRAL